MWNAIAEKTAPHVGTVLILAEQFRIIKAGNRGERNRPQTGDRTAAKSVLEASNWGHFRHFSTDVRFQPIASAIAAACPLVAFAASQVTSRFRSISVQ